MFDSYKMPGQSAVTCDFVRSYRALPVLNSNDRFTSPN
jgi:hypothetical protein